MTRFEPVGDRPMWEMIYDELNPLSIGDVITFETMAGALDCDPSERDKIRSAFRKAAEVYGNEHKRAFAPVVGVGYRMVDAPEHEALARRQHVRSKRALKRGRQVLNNADRSRLTPEQASKFDSMETTIARHEDMIRRIDARQDRTEKAVREARKKTDATDAEVAATRARVDQLEEALRRHGIDPSAA